MKSARWWPVAITVAVMAVTVFGGYVVTAVLAKPAGPPVVVGGAVRVFPLSGWEEAGEGGLGDLAGARITRGNATLDVLTRPSALGAEAVLVRYVERFLRPGARTLEVSQDVREVSLDSGLKGLRVSYVGSFGDRAAEVEGEVTTAVSPSGTTVIYDAWGPSGLFGYARADTREMVRTSEVA